MCEMGAIMDGSEGGRVVLADLHGTAEELRYSATLSTDAGECTVGVWEYKVV